MLLKKKQLALGLYLLTVASGLCLAGLKAIDRHLSEKGRRT
jgi:hypothetical protein